MKTKPIPQDAAVKIIKRFLPRGWRYAETMNGRRVEHTAIGTAYFRERIIVTIPVHNVYTLLVFLHEIAHVRLKHGTRSISDWRGEWEAERWAIRVCRRLGYGVPKLYLDGAKRYVYWFVKAALKKGEKVPTKIRRWIGKMPEHSVIMEQRRLIRQEYRKW